MRFYLLFFLRFAASSNSPDHALLNQRRVYGRELLRGERPFENEVPFLFQTGGGRQLYYYSKNQVEMLNFVTEYLKMRDSAMRRQLEMQDPDMESVDDDDDFFPLPDFISKDDINTVMNILDDHPIIDMNAEAFSHILRVAQFLDIAEKHGERFYLQEFFSKVCAHSILGTHSTDILNTRLYSQFEPSFEIRVDMYTHLARAFANVFSLQVKILEEKRTDPRTNQEPGLLRTLIFHTSSYEHPKEHKVLGFSVGIDTIKITPAALSKVETRDNPLHIIAWLFDHTKAKGLDLSGCFVGGDIIEKIANMNNLKILNLSRCELQPRSLVPIGNSPILQNKLRELHADYNKFDRNDTKALALLTVLEVLRLSGCKLQIGSLVPIGESGTLRGVLCELYADENQFDLDDTTALALLTALKIINLSRCELQPGTLVPICESQTLRGVLRELYADENEFGLNDTTALALLIVLEVLRLSDCKLQRGTLVPIGESGTLQGVLRELHADENQFGFNDTKALALLTVLEVLRLSGCELQPGTLVPIGGSGTLRGVLRELYADENQFDLDDTTALALLTALKIINLSRCELQPGTLVPIGESETLRGVLRELYADENQFDRDDTTALALLAVLKLLRLSDCELQPGTLVPIGESETLQGVLRELYADESEFDFDDTTALALLTVLEVLSLSNCELQPGTLVPIGESETLRDVLCELYADENQFDLDDTTALALLAVLKVLKLRICGLQLGTLVPIGESGTLRGMLRELYADGNQFGLNDTTALAPLTVLEVLSLSRCELPPGALIPIGNSLTLKNKLRELDVTDNQNLGPEDERIIAELRHFITIRR